MCVCVSVSSRYRTLAFIVDFFIDSSARDDNLSLSLSLSLPRVLNFTPIPKTGRGESKVNNATVSRDRPTKDKETGCGKDSRGKKMQWKVQFVLSVCEGNLTT